MDSTLQSRFHILLTWGVEEVLAFSDLLRFKYLSESAYSVAVGSTVSSGSPNSF